MKVEIGQVWRMAEGGTPMYVTAVKGRFAFVKHADSPKKVLANEAGGYLTALSEFDTWTLLKEASA